MNIAGVIVEYNPFHEGHRYHIKKTKELTGCDAVIAVMSGNFVQRGIPAVIDKWNRTKMALLSGVDLVIELPVLYSLSSAEFFSYGAISLLESLGAVNSICFGSECGDTAVLNSIAQILYEEPTEFNMLLKENLSLGMSYPTARSKALVEFFSTNQINTLENNLESILSSSNNILGIEYCKSLKKLNSTIDTFSIKRSGAAYNSISLDDGFSSASSIRNFLKENSNMDKLKSHLPESVYDLILGLNKSNYTLVFEDMMTPYLKYKSILYKDTMESLPDVSEGIHNRIFKALEKSNSYNEVINSAKTKRYTYTRISRILCQFFVGFEKFNTEKLRRSPCPYGRILGFNNRGIDVLRELKKKSKIPLYTKLPKEKDSLLSLDILSTEVYSLLNKAIASNSDYTISPIMFDI